MDYIARNKKQMSQFILLCKFFLFQLKYADNHKDVIPVMPQW